MIRNQSFEVERKAFQEESGWLLEHLKKDVDLEASRGFIRKMRGKTRTHLMEICFNSRGRYMKITEFVAKRKPLVLVVPEGVIGYGWENLRKAIVSVQDLKGPRNGAVMPVGKWARAVVCESKGKIRDWCDVGKAIARRVGMKGMVSVTPISAYKGCFFVDSARRAQWIQDQGSLTARGEVIALRRWLPKENSVVNGKFRRGWLELRGLPFHLWDEAQLRYILQKWGKVTKVVRESLKLVDLTKVKLWVEMLPNVVLPALLEVEDGDWTYTVAVTVTGEDDGEDSIRPESNRSKDELRSVGGCVFQKPQIAEGLRATARDNECHSWRPRHRSHSRSPYSKSSKGEKGKGRCMLGPTAGSNVGPTKPDAFKARSDWAQFGAKDFGPLAGPAHEGSSNGGPASTFVFKALTPRVLCKEDNAESSSSRVVKAKRLLSLRKAQSKIRGGVFYPEANIQSFTGETEGDEGISQCKLVNKVRPPFLALSEQDLPLVGAFEPKFLLESSVSLVHPSRCVAFPLETCNRKFKDRPFLRETLSNPEERGVSGEASSPELEPSTLPLEGFQVEGLTPRKMVKVQSVLESLRIRIVRDNGKGVEGENKSALSADKILSWNTRGLGSRKKRRTVRRFLSTQNPDVVMLQETKRVIWDRRFVSSVWKGRSLEWAALPACGASGGIVILWDSIKFKLYGPNKPLWRKDFWLELQDLYGLTFPRWCVGGDFNVSGGYLRRWVTLEALPRWTSDHSPICLETNPLKWGPTPFRFENMWLLHPEFKEKFRDWWQECTVEGWEGHKFMRKLKIDLIEQLNKKNLDLVFGKDLKKEGARGFVIKGRGDSWRLKGLIGPLFLRECIWLDRPFSEEEVRMAVFQLNKEKAPGPDGFTIAVYQECWDVIKEDLMRVFFEFHTKGPISLVTSLYKIIAKVLSGRLRKVLHETIFGSQGAFVEGRQILDAVLIANEVVDEKRRKGFSQKWRSWMRGCLSSSSFAILVNGNAKGWVKASRGLRQGDPLSPFLFTLVADVLSRLMIRAEETGITEGFFVGRDRTRSVRVAFVLFRPSFGREPKDNRFWDPVVERISRRLDGWKKAYLSLGGRITLIQSCLSHIPSYFLSLFKIPVSIASKIEKMQRDFLWSGGGREERSPYQMGGKWLWRFLEKGAVFGIRLLRVYMGHILMDGTPTRWLDGHKMSLEGYCSSFPEFPFCPPSGGQWGENSVLEDLWWGNQTLCSQFADLYRVISVKNLTVSNVLGNSLPCLGILTFAAI
ncbi:Transposon TX1 uncharacterized 149 kDa protein [Vitis vinifera]|uniref:Transposon TX1 uncharacterized 149 kDa protein n=1 Tax=Vitis vinifera TaxID=29760 RepID=A0A438H059_VITVI|nr:Transposon TX1 uncharacterized 149 kDa protein [Vitis vinifera]